MAKRPPRVPRFEGSALDNAQDAQGAGLLGITPQQYEMHPADRLQDIAGQARLNRAHQVKAAANQVIATHKGRGKR